MADPGQTDRPPPASGGERPAAASGTTPHLMRGFLFADLRDYTGQVESRGDHAAVAPLERYRLLVRNAVASANGAEIKRRRLVDWLGIERRRLGTGMVIFGVVGVLLAGVIGLGLIAGAVSMRNLDDRLTTQQASVAESLDRASTSLSQLASTTDHASTTLATSGVAVAHAGQGLDELANVSSDLQQTLDISILGQHPLASAASKFGDLGRRAREFSGDAAALAAALATNAADVSTLATPIRSLQDRATALSDQVRNYEGTGKLVGLLTVGVLLVGLMVVWLAVLALGVAWAGWRLRRAVPPGAP
jgi:hypothetical protein